MDISFIVEGKKRVATIKDYSEDGAMIIYLGERLPLNAFFICSVEELDIKRPARAVWTRQIDKSVNATGLQLL